MNPVISYEQALSCCSSTVFARNLSTSGAQNWEAVLSEARSIWWRKVPPSGWLEAFAAHPRIGDLDGLKRKYGDFADMSRSEQASASGASERTLQDLASWNKSYEERFGFIFIICASGKSAAEMLAAVKARYANSPYIELACAAVEQMKITEMRLLRLLGAASDSAEGAAEQADRRADGQPLRSPITTHVLDTSRGSPAQGVQIVLSRRPPGSYDMWEAIARGVTNADGRVPDLLPPASSVQPGMYKITFDMEEYMEQCAVAHPGFYSAQPFYPKAEVQFRITKQQSRDHFHVPLTWNPYGYSTYRGS